MTVKNQNQSNYFIYLSLNALAEHTVVALLTERTANQPDLQQIKSIGL